MTSRICHKCGKPAIPFYWWDVVRCTKCADVYLRLQDRLRGINPDSRRQSTESLRQIRRES